MADIQFEHDALIMSGSSSRVRRLASRLGEGILFLITSLSMLAILFIFYFIAKDALPFFTSGHISDFFFLNEWYPTAETPVFGAKAIFYGTLIVTGGAIIVAVPLGIGAAVCLSDILPFSVRQVVKPVVEMLASIPSVAYGFFALVVLAPQLQSGGGPLLATVMWLIGTPLVFILSLLMGSWISAVIPSEDPKTRGIVGSITGGIALIAGIICLWLTHVHLQGVEILSGTNALNASLILGIMAFPTVVSVSEDAIQAVGQELREASYGLGATRAETLVKVVIPAASSGICAAIILGIMRAVGETMVVWMASGNAAQIPQPWYDMTQAVRTLTATIAGDMGEADQTTGSNRFHVLFAMAFSLLVISFICNVVSEQIIRYNRKRLKGEVG